MTKSPNPPRFMGLWQMELKLQGLKKEIDATGNKAQSLIDSKWGLANLSMQDVNIIHYAIAAAFDSLSLLEAYIHTLRKVTKHESLRS